MLSISNGLYRIADTESRPPKESRKAFLNKERTQVCDTTAFLWLVATILRSRSEIGRAHV